jgi:uncharacterized protein (TIGR03435 family)
MLSAMRTFLRRRVVFALLLSAAVVFSAQAQAPGPQTSASAASGTTSTPAPAFEVASVRLGDQHPAPIMPGDQPVSPFPTNRYYAHNLNLKLIIALAYNIDQGNIEGGQSWIEATNYSIDAKVEGEQQLTYDQIKPLLQNLLAQRLGLKLHHVSKLGAGFDLVVAKDGPKLQPAKGDRKPWFQILPNRLDGWSGSTGNLATMVSHALSQPVVDHTGLTASYDIHLKFAPSNDPNSSLPDIFTAVQEQLGLKLIPAKVPVDYLVIDHVDRVPTEN